MSNALPFANPNFWIIDDFCSDFFYILLNLDAHLLKTSEFLITMHLGNQISYA